MVIVNGENPKIPVLYLFGVACLWSWHLVLRPQRACTELIYSGDIPHVYKEINFNLQVRTSYYFGLIHGHTGAPPLDPHYSLGGTNVMSNILIVCDVYRRSAPPMPAIFLHLCTQLENKNMYTCIHWHLQLSCIMQTQDQTQQYLH